MNRYGRIALTIDGTTYDVRGTFQINGAGLSSEAAAGASGGVYITEKPEPVRISIAFDRGSTLWTSGLLTRTLDARIVEESNGARHYVTAGALVGDPQYDALTGEVSGLTLVCSPANYREVRSS